MNYEEESFVKVFTRDTPRWLKLSPLTRGLLLELSRKVDKRGFLSMGGEGIEGLAILLRGAWEDIRPHIEALIGAAYLAYEPKDGTIFIPGHEERQESRMSDTLRKREQRARERSRGVTDGHAPSHAVTRGHAESRGVTGVTIDQIDQIRSDQIDQKEAAEGTPAPAAPTAAAPKVPRPRKKPRGVETPCPSPEDPDAEAWCRKWGIPSPRENWLAKKFLRWHRQKEITWVNWGQTWRGWMDRQQESGGMRASSESTEEARVQAMVESWGLAAGGEP